MIFVLSSFSIRVEPGIAHLDKLVHALEFGIFSLLLYQAMRNSFLKASVLTLTAFALVVSVLSGALDEYYQSFNPFRNADALDLLADASGAVIAQGIILLRAFWWH